MSDLETMYLIPKELYNHLIQNANNSQKKSITNLNVKQLNNFESENDHVNIEFNETENSGSILSKPKRKQTKKQVKSKVTFKDDVDEIDNENVEVNSSSDEQFRGINVPVQTDEIYSTETQTQTPGSSHFSTQTNYPTVSHYGTQTSDMHRTNFGTQFTPSYENVGIQAVVRPKHKHASSMCRPATRNTGTQLTKGPIRMKNAGTQDTGSSSIQTQTTPEVKEQHEINTQTDPQKSTRSTSISRIGSVTVKRTNTKPLKFSDWLLTRKRPKTTKVSKAIIANIAQQSVNSKTPQDTKQEVAIAKKVQVHQNRASQLKLKNTTSKLHTKPYETPKQRKMKASYAKADDLVDVNPDISSSALGQEVHTSTSKMKGNGSKPTFRPYETPKQRNIKNRDIARSRELKKLAEEAKQKPTIILPKSVKRKYAADHKEDVKKLKNKHSILGYKRRSVEPIRRMVRRKKKKDELENDDIEFKETTNGNGKKNGNGSVRKNGNGKKNGNGNNSIQS